MHLNPDFLNELRKRFEGEIKTDPASRILYSTDASIYQIEPLGVAIPKTQEDLHAAVELAGKFKIPILPRGSGSSLGGQAIGEALILDCSRYLDRILEIDPVTHSAIVEPGVILADLNRVAGKHGLMYGPDPASAERATMGGVIGNNATGAHSILYGMSADHILSADVLLADGTQETWSTDGATRLSSVIAEIREQHADTIKTHFPRTWRNSAGFRLNYLLPWSPSIPAHWDVDDYGMSVSVYMADSEVNIAALLAGSEGTLAVMRRVKVNLVKKPSRTLLAVIPYDAVASACDDVPRLLEFKPSAIELIPRLILKLARGVPAYARQMDWITGDPAAVLVVEFSGDRNQNLKASAERLGNAIAIAESGEEQARIWNIRRMGLGILDSRPRAARPAAFIEDCAIPVERLGEFIREVEFILAEHNAEGGIYAHASAGCLHIRPVLNLHEREGVFALRSISEQVFKLTMRLGGSMSSEHGDGIVAGEWIEKTYGSEVAEAMRMLKRAADPCNLLNPNKMLDAPAMDTRLRYGTGYSAKAWAPALHFEHERSLPGAIEQCNGQGVCRKHTGMMCPSFQATREESNSTRGRANLLRALISSGSNNTTSNNPEVVNAVFSALDLCLACKGCTSECPSGVDMPKLKYEFLNEYYKIHRHPLRDFLFGYFHLVAGCLQPVAPLANALMRVKWVRLLIASALGLTTKRPFPVFAWKKSWPAHAPDAERKVIFLSDVFSRFIEPDVEQAAFDLLGAFGYEVFVLPTIGAGAALLSKGFIKSARRHAEKTLAAIRRLDDGAGLCVVGCEPPEIYCLKREYAALMPDRGGEIESLVQRTWLLEEFLMRKIGFEELRVVMNRGGHKDSIHIPREKIYFHPHCHQQAEPLANDGLPSGASATIAWLQRIGCEVEMIDGGCCGMAGTFGYDADHYELSIQVGELSVLPKARAIKNIVSSGSACRMQIRHAGGMEAKHPIVVARNLLLTPAQSGK